MCERWHKNSYDSLGFQLQPSNQGEALEKPAIQGMQKELQTDLSRMESKILTNLTSFMWLECRQTCAVGAGMGSEIEIKDGSNMNLRQLMAIVANFEMTPSAENFN